MHSLLLVPADEARLRDALGLGASVVVADVTDGGGSVEDRRAVVHDWLRDAVRAEPWPRLYVRIHDTGSAWIEDDLDTLIPAGPDGVLLSAPAAWADIQRVGVKLAVREAEHGLAEGDTGIIAIPCGSAASLRALGGPASPSARLRGVAWDAASLAADLGIEADPRAAPLLHARAVTILAARAARVPAFDMVAGSLDDVVRACARGRRDGFCGALTGQPELVPLIASAYADGWSRPIRND